MITAERQRQITIEGFTDQYDDGHLYGELATAAACYADPGSVFPNSWPWDPMWDKRKKHNRIEQLAIAGALCAAEIDRLKRFDAQIELGLYRLRSRN